MKIDIFNHLFPTGYFEKMMEVAPNHKDIGKRIRAIPALVDREQRFRIMDQFDEYTQVISLASPPIEALGNEEITPSLAKVANDGMAEYVDRYPSRFAVNRSQFTDSLMYLLSRLTDNGELSTGFTPYDLDVTVFSRCGPCFDFAQDDSAAGHPEQFDKLSRRVKRNSASGGSYGIFRIAG